MLWCKQVGVICPKLEYPHFFEGGLVGVRAKAPIPHRQAFLFVPQSVIISLDKCKSCTALQPIFTENPQIFSDKLGDWEQIMISVFLLY